MKTKFCSIVFAVSIMTVVSQSIKAQVQERVKKDKWVEAIYPEGGWLLPLDEEKGIIQIRLHVNRYNIPATMPDHYKGWGEIELSDIDFDENGLLGAPTQIGDVYYFGITSKSGSSRIGIQKLRDNPDDNPYLKIVEVSGAIAKWVKQGSKLFVSQGNGRLYNPTVLAMTENELDEILKRCNNDNYIDYNWWVKNRNSSNALSKPTVTKSSGQLYLMGIPVKQPKVKLDAQLKAKGFVQKMDEYGNVELFGSVDGVSVRIFTADKCLTVTDKKLYSYANAKKRFSALLTRMTSEYGKGKYTSEGEDIRTYQIDGSFGTIEISMWDSDEANCNSGKYLVSITYNAIYATATSSAGTATTSENSTPPVKTVTLESLLKVSGQNTQPKQSVHSPKPEAQSATKRMQFLGLELGTDGKKFEQALRKRGFINGNGFGDNKNYIFLKGEVYEKIYTEKMKCSQTSDVSILLENGVVKEVMAVDYVTSEAAAKKRWNVYKQHITSEYGQGKITYHGNYEVDLPYGTASCNYGVFDSGDCEVMMKVTMK